MSLLRTVFGNRCPHCSEGPVFRGLYEMHEKCPSCQAVYDRDGGLWTGPVVTSYSFGTLGAFALWIWMFMTDRDFDGSEYMLMAIAAVVCLGTYRYAKSSWLWLLYRTNRVFPDGQEPPV